MHSICITVPRIGPYHLARFNSAGALGEIHVVETCPVDAEYDWDEVTQTGSFARHTLFEAGSEETQSPDQIRSRMWKLLDQVRPDAVAIMGWSLCDALAALAWCSRHQVPAVVMSESQRLDHKRTFIKETIKRRIIGFYRTALAGGTPHAEYLEQLGMPRERVFLGYDVVDNFHFQSGADEARSDAVAARMRLGLPENYFLASSRFIPKKNLPGLLRAFAEYRRQSGDQAWDLVLLGDGSGKPELLAMIKILRLEESVRLPGFQQYPSLPTYYGLAGAFVHASQTEQWGLVVNEAMAAGLPVLVSQTCGCAPDLVEQGANGFTFDPEIQEEFVNRLLLLADDDSIRERMGARSREIISRWTPNRFGESLWKAGELAIELGPVSPKMVDRAILHWLSRRSA